MHSARPRRAAPSTRAADGGPRRRGGGGAQGCLGGDVGGQLGDIGTAITRPIACYAIVAAILIAPQLIRWARRGSSESDNERTAEAATSAVLKGTS